MTAIVLCGGQSTRMGTDKGLLLKDGKTWAEIASNQLASLELPVFISVNLEQATSYLKLFPLKQLIMDDETILVKGPLLGLLTAHRQFPGEDLLVLACDMIDMKKSLLLNLVKEHHAGLHDACVYRVKEKSQPLCAIYSAKALNHVYQLYQQGSINKFSMMHILDRLDVQYLPVETALEVCFNNYNSAEDLELNHRDTEAQRNTEL